MPLEVPLTLAPMEAEPVDALPSGKGWAFEPKYDGFRCLIFRDGDQVDLQSRRQRPLQRFFPEMAAAALTIERDRFVLDGELVIPGQPFDALQARLHPAASRIAKLSAETPAVFMAFDLLAGPEGESWLRRPFVERRAGLEALPIALADRLVVSETTASAAAAQEWLKDLGRGLDGIVAKRLDLSYQPGRRAMQKYKLWRSVDCVVGGLYFKADGKTVEHLLLGLHDAEGLLNYVGRCGVGENGREIGDLVRPLIGGSGFTGKAPGGPSRWSRRERSWTALQPKLVAEVSADHIEAGRFRHGSRLLRWRDDKDPRDCTMDQMT